MGGLPGLVWHYLPVAVVATIVMIILPGRIAGGGECEGATCSRCIATFDLPLDLRIQAIGLLRK